MRKNIQCPIILCFGVYTTTPYALSCKIQKFKFYVNWKKSKYYLGTPMLTAKLFWIYSVRKNIKCPFLLSFNVYTTTQYALSCKMRKLYFYANREKSKYYLGTPMLIENGSEYHLSEKIYNNFFTNFWSIYTNSIRIPM